MKHLSLFACAVVLLLSHVADARYHGRRSITHAPRARSFTITNSSDQPIILYFKPLVKARQDHLPASNKCAADACLHSTHKTRIGYQLAPHSTDTINLMDQELKTLDTFQGIILNTHLTYGSVSYYHTARKQWAKKYLTIYDQAHYTITIVHDELTITRS